MSRPPNSNHRQSLICMPGTTNLYTCLYLVGCCWPTFPASHFFVLFFCLLILHKILSRSQESGPRSAPGA